MKGYEYIPPEIFERLEFKKSKDEEASYPELIRIRPISLPCEDCGEIVEDRRTTTSVRQTPLPHTRTSCSICKRFKNPETGEFDLERNELDAIYYQKKLKKHK
jgi:hypothetical protein